MEARSTLEGWCRFGPMTQWIRRRTSNPKIAGSSPAGVRCRILLLNGALLGGVDPHALRSQRRCRRTPNAGPPRFRRALDFRNFPDFPDFRARKPCGADAGCVSQTFVAPNAPQAEKDTLWRYAGPATVQAGRWICGISGIFRISGPASPAEPAMLTQEVCSQTFAAPKACQPDARGKRHVVA